MKDVEMRKVIVETLECAKEPMRFYQIMDSLEGKNEVYVVQANLNQLVYIGKIKVSRDGWGKEFYSRH